jgi:hypothetical protein
MIRVLLVIMCLAALDSLALAQSSLPFAVIGGTDIVVHKDFTGQPCLKVSGSARAHTIDPHLYDHVISVTNSCPERITIKVCYYHTEDCIPMEIPGNDQKQAILGTMPGQTGFRFEYREQ